MEELNTLVERTAGAQPWRKVLHAVTGLVIVTVLTVLEPSQRIRLLMLGAIASSLFALDLTRLVTPRANELFFRLFNRLASPREMRGIASSTWSWPLDDNLTIPIACAAVVAAVS
jgi:dolichol kinase